MVLMNMTTVTRFSNCRPDKLESKIDNLIFAGLLILLLACGATVNAQQPQKVYKIGRLSQGSLADPLNKATLAAFLDGLRVLGWVEGQNILIENRWVGDKLGSAGSLAAELVRLKVDVIVAVGSPMVQAAKQATTVIPIVMSGSGADPEAAGFVASLRRPGGNITGLSMLSTELSGKRLELLKEMTPKLERVAALRNPNFPAVAIQSKETELAAKSLGLQLRAWDVGGAQEIDRAFASMSKTRIGGLLVFSDPAILERNRKAIIDLASKFRIPTLYPWRNYVEEGGLASYSASLLDMHRRSATSSIRSSKALRLPSFLSSNRSNSSSSLIFNPPTKSALRSRRMSWSERIG